ncbi:60S ribosomal protein L18a-like protein [Prosopis cineraria]|uniref:60S ribosomal protein L18a-like protein n=1 Tax=Prosopis cineraria TaxID=364024 RepID=UPI00241007C2|nr:60S ribosomal protein L18a-like protein [Prosopis cineraria]
MHFPLCVCFWSDHAVAGTESQLRIQSLGNLDQTKESKADDGKAVSSVHHRHYPSPPPSSPPPPQYPPLQCGAFQGISNNHPAPQPPISYHQAVPSPGAVNTSHPHGYAVTGGMPVTESQLPCCGIGFGWFMFIIGFVLSPIPWYVGAFLLFCKMDPRERSGHIACAVAAVLFTIAIIAIIIMVKNTGSGGSR